MVEGQRGVPRSPGKTESPEDRGGRERWPGFAVPLALSSAAQRLVGGGTAAAGRVQLIPAQCPEPGRKTKGHTHFTDLS